ncbi:hypothetical protein [Kitasatospora sp. NPDC005856]|uniref:hypothetical protein n=1 Tax=Kitasatospora sp. NPDC005856 TaxID=3154566 RepID=UPI0033FFB24D
MTMTPERLAAIKRELDEAEVQHEKADRQHIAAAFRYNEAERKHEEAEKRLSLLQMQYNIALDELNREQ